MSVGPSIAWVGFHEEGRYALPALIEEGFEVRAVFSLSQEAAERRSGVFDFESLARAHGIPYHAVDHINDATSIDLLRSYSPDVLCVIGWSQILSPEALDTAGITIGAHASPLPKGRGSAPVNWALIKGWTETGNTLIRLSEGVDEGDILAQRRFEITEFDSCATLYDKVAGSNASMLVEAMHKIRDGTLDPVPQVDDGESLLPRRTPEQGRIDWATGGKAVYDFVRALTRPYPGAFGFVNGDKVYVWCASWSSRDTDAPPGVVIGARTSFEPAACSVTVGCGSGAVSVHEIEVMGQGVLQGEEMIRFLEQAGRFDTSDD